MSNSLIMIPTTLFLFLLLILIAFLIAVPLVTSNVVFMEEVDNSHAFLKHGLDAVAARECRDNPNSFIFYSAERNRYARVCFTSKDRWGIYIHEVDSIFSEVTAFVRNRSNQTFQKVVEYLRRSGYELIQ